MPGRFGRKPLLGEQINWSHPLSKGLVGSWLFNEGSGDIVYDSSLNGSDGTLISMVPSEDWVVGHDGWALDFDVNDLINITHSAELSLVQPFSIYFWIKFTTTSNLVVFEKNGNNGFSVQTVESRIQLNVGGVATDVNVLRSASVINDGLWHHVVFVMPSTASGASLVYVDGVEDTGATRNETGVPDYGASTPIEIGSRSGASGFAGSLSDIRLYKRALTSKEVESLYINPYAMFDKLLFGRIFVPDEVITPGLDLSLEFKRVIDKHRNILIRL